MIFGAITGFRLVSAEPQRLAAFYEALGFKVDEPVPIPVADMEVLGLQGTGRRIAMTLGGYRLDLESFSSPGRPYPANANASDIVFQHLALVTDDAEVAWSRARDVGATRISRARDVTLPKAAGGVTAVKFRDPEGHPLEFLQFPREAHSDWNGKGILGIDHSAISVGDAGASRDFYASGGLRAKEPMVNRGPTQDALDGLDDVEVEVVPMRPPDTPPHLELLGYRHPAGRPLGSLAPNDIAATRIVWRSNKDALIRDPDGHFFELSQ